MHTRTIGFLACSVMMIACGASSGAQNPNNNARDDCVLAYSGQRFEEASERCLAACDAGSDGGCAILARMYEGGEGVPEDAGKGREFRERACRAGDLDSCQAAEITDPAIVVPASAKRCAIAREDDRSVAATCREAGLAYLDGKGVPVDRAQAERLLRKACKLGELAACDAFSPR